MHGGEQAHIIQQPEKAGNCEDSNLPKYSGYLAGGHQNAENQYSCGTFTGDTTVHSTMNSINDSAAPTFVETKDPSDKVLLKRKYTEVIIVEKENSNLPPPSKKLCLVAKDDNIIEEELLVDSQLGLGKLFIKGKFNPQSDDRAIFFKNIKKIVVPSL